MAAAKSVTVKFDKERETKNTVRYAEVAEPEDQVIRTLYLAKDAVAELGNPEAVTVTVKAG